MRLRMVVCCLVLLSCATDASTPGPGRNSDPPPPFGDAIDDAAWEALGPRPAGSRPLREPPIRLRDYWTVDPIERGRRIDLATRLTRAGNKALEKQEFRLDLYLDAIRVAPLFLPPWSPATRMLFEDGEVSRAQALAHQYVRIAPPGDGQPWFLLGKCQIRLGKTEQAMQSFERALRSPVDPQPDAAAALALLHLQEGRLHAAESLQTLYDIREPSIALLLRGKKARARGDLHETARAFEELVRLPDAPRGSWEELASVELQRGNHAAARDAFEHALEESPQRTGPLIGLARLDIAQGHFDDAAERLQRLVAAHPDNLTGQFNLGVALLGRARSGETMPANAKSLADLRGAERAWSTCIDRDFETEASLWGRAEAALWRGDPSRASFDAQRLFERAADIPAAQARWARLLVSTGHETEALASLQEAARHDELDRDGRSLLAQLEDRAGSDALDLLRRAFDEDPDNTVVGSRLGVALLVDGQLEEAERVLRAVVALRPADPDALQNLAAVLDRRKKYREAQALLIKAESLR